VFVFYLAVIFLVSALLLFYISSLGRRKVGIPGGRVIYSDTSRWQKNEKPLFDPALKLAGRPDYLVEQGRHIIPVEVKTGRSPQHPYDSHIFQLAAYCLLVNSEYGTRPKYGIIHYPTQTFAIDFTPALEETTKEIIRQIQASTSGQHVDRSHANPHNCQRCGYRSICDQSLRI
jgi:CRISPR-associated exonuclease Cas4